MTTEGLKKENRVIFRAKRFLGKCARRIQDIAIYKSLVRSFLPDIKISSFERPAHNVQDFHVKIFAAETLGKEIGSVCLVRNAGLHRYAGYWLQGLKVRFFYRRMGIGEKLTLAVIEAARSEGAEEISLTVFEDNREAVRLYSKLGFKYKVVPDLEAELQKEAAFSGCRRVVMSRKLTEK